MCQFRQCRRFFLLTPVAVLALLLVPLSPVPAQDADSGTPKRVLDRAAADAAVLLPQRGLGGTTKPGPAPKRTQVEVPIGAEGCEKMVGYIEAPDPLPEGKKLALVFGFHGNGDTGRGRVRCFAGTSTEADPVIAIGVQYQQLKENGGGEFNAPTLCSGQKILEGSRWLLDKVLAEYPVDENRIFVGGFSWGTSWASNWARQEWQNDPAAFPFRAVFLCGSPAYGSKEQLPPVPWIFTYGEKETNVKGNNVVGAVRGVANRMSAWGFPVQCHEIPGMGHSMNGQVVQIIREVINQCGGPGLPEAATAAGSGNAAARDPLPFEASEDPYVTEVVAMCNEDRWVEAVARVHEIEKDRQIRGREKKEIRNFDRDIEKVARDAFPKVEESLKAAAAAERLPSPHDVARLKGIAAAFPDAIWLKNRDNPLAALAPFGDDFPPRVREREREAAMRAAWKAEQSGDRAAAKAGYQQLAARASEDHGASIWPGAAEYRLLWWID